MIVFPPLRAGPSGEPTVRRGDGFTLYTPMNGDAWITLSAWSVAAERAAHEATVTHVILDRGWTDASIKRLLPLADTLAELTIAVDRVLDLSDLPCFGKLRRLKLHDSVQVVPFEAMLQLRSCEILGRSTKALGSIGSAPSLESLTLGDLELRNVEKLSSLATLKHLDLRGLRKLGALDGIEGLALESIELHLPSLQSIELLRKLPLKFVRLETSKRLTDTELLGDIGSLEGMTLVAIAPVSSLQFIERLPKLAKLTLAGTPILEPHASVRAFESSRCLRELSLVGGKASLENVTDLETLSSVTSLESLHVQRGPREIDSLSWVQSLEQLRVFRLQGTKIADGDLTPLLRLPRLERATIDPIGPNYTHADASFSRDMNAALAARIPGVSLATAWQQ